MTSLPFLCTHAHPAPHPPPGAPQKNEAPARAERAWLEASLSNSSCGAAPVSPLGSRTSAATLSPPWSQAVPRGTFLAIPAPLPRRPGARPPGGAGEGRERPREARPPATGLCAATQSARPGPRHLFPPSPRGWGRLLSVIPLHPAAKFPRLGLPEGPGGCPGKPRRAAATKARAASGPWRTPRATSGHSPGRPGATRVPPEHCWRPTAGASAGDERGGGGSAGRERLGSADPGRPPWRLLSWAPHSGSGAALRLHAGFRAEGARKRPMGTPRAG